MAKVSEKEIRRAAVNKAPRPRVSSGIARASRKATIELDRVHGLRPPPASVNGHSLASIFDAAGIRLTVSLDDAALPDAPDGDFDVPQLHEYMTAHRQANRPRWHAHVLVVPRIRWQDGFQEVEPLGVMYDDARIDPNTAPREGCALSLDEIGDNEPEYLRTLAHELGHVFNLEHTTTAGDHSIMCSTEDLIGDGGYPDNIEFEFNEKDANWLKNGPEESVRPGGSGVRSTNNSNMGTPPGSAVTLVVSTRHAAYVSGDPVFLRVTLRNDSDIAQTVSSSLSTASGNVEVSITPPGGKPFRFRPLFRADFKAAPTTIAPGEEFLANEPLFFGARGLTFTQPGTYQVAARYRDVIDGKRRSLASDPVDVEILPSHEAPLLTPNAARYLVLRGGRHLDDAQHVLWQVSNRADRPWAAYHARLALAAAALRAGAPQETERLLAAVPTKDIDRAHRADLFRLRAAASRANREPCLRDFGELLRKSRRYMAEQEIARTRAWIVRHGY